MSVHEALRDAAKRIASLEKERDAWKACAEKVHRWVKHPLENQDTLMEFLEQFDQLKGAK